MKKVFLLIGFMLLPLQVLADQNFHSEIIKVKIISVQEKDCGFINDPILNDKCTVLILESLNGSVKGKQFERDFSEMASVQELASDHYKVGQVYYAEYSRKIDGTDLLILQSIYRIPQLFILMGIFAFLVIIFGRKQGLKALIAMIISFLILIYIISQGLLAGQNVYLFTFFGSVLIMLVSLYLTYGFNAKTHSAFLGSLVTLIITFILGYWALGLTELTGFASEESNFLQMAYVDLNMRHILFAGMMIGVLGVLDDIAVGQASAVFQIIGVDAKLSFQELYAKAIVIGKDHVASMVNTLIIAYAGAAFPLFLLFVQDRDAPFYYILNSELVAEEVVRMLVGSMGILLAVPLTTLIACRFAKKHYYAN